MKCLLERGTRKRRHSVLDCRGLNPVSLEEVPDIARVLGFAMKDGSLHLSKVTQTKQGLVE